MIARRIGAVFTLVGVLGPVHGEADGTPLVFGRNCVHDAVIDATRAATAQSGSPTDGVVG